MTAFGRNQMSAESAHLSTFGAEIETKAEIRSTSSHGSVNWDSCCVMTAVLLSRWQFIHGSNFVTVWMKQSVTPASDLAVIEV